MRILITYILINCEWFIIKLCGIGIILLTDLLCGITSYYFLIDLRFDCIFNENGHGNFINCISENLNMWKQRYKLPSLLSKTMRWTLPWVGPRELHERFLLTDTFGMKHWCVHVKYKLSRNSPSTVKNTAIARYPPLDSLRLCISVMFTWSSQVFLVVLAAFASLQEIILDLQIRISFSLKGY